ncbi:MAG: CDP-alcohol phosphatidyltransferase family protein [Candidatus Aureabacteria bacterium]|nr:CDP-alcohol phosphatidyltransferase family protein [Candidatus Auribacterota bacterium]
MNWANKISVIRMLLVPCFVAVMHYFRVSENGQDEALRFIAIGFFAVAMLTDALDGFIARHFNQKSRLGTILDPIADKLLLTSAVIVLTFPSMAKTSMEFSLPYWYAVAVITRDVIILLGSFLVWMILGDVHVRPSIFGKVTTFLQMTTVLWVLFIIPNPMIIVYLSTLLTVVSGADYMIKGARQLVSAEEEAGKKKRN